MKIKSIAIILGIALVFIILTLYCLFSVYTDVNKNHGDSRVNNLVAYTLLVLLILTFIYLYKINNNSCIDSIQHCRSMIETLFYIPIGMLIILRIYAHYKLKNANIRGIEKITDVIWTIFLIFLFVGLTICVVFYGIYYIKMICNNE